MRDDFRLAVFVLFALILALVAYVVFALSPGADDRDWEQRWSGLDELDRAWIAAASRSRGSRATLDERQELVLAKGFNRREARRRAYILLATLLPLLAVAILMATGLVSDRWASALLGSFALLQALIGLYRDRQIKNRYRETQDRYLAAPTEEPAPTV